jgi:replicative DNA helicase Mcm
MLYLDSELNYAIYNRMLNMMEITPQFETEFIDYYKKNETRVNFLKYLKHIQQYITIKASKKICSIGEGIFNETFCVKTVRYNPYFLFNLINYVFIQRKRDKPINYAMKIEGLINHNGIPTVAINSLSVGLDEQMIRMRGVIKSNTGTFPMLKYGYYVCKNCECVMERYHEYNNFIKPSCSKMKSCRKEMVVLDNRRSTYIDIQKIEVQEVQENLAPGEQPKTISGFHEIRHGLNLKPGIELYLIGVIRKHNIDINKVPFYQQYFDICDADIEFKDLEPDEATVKVITDKINENYDAYWEEIIEWVTPMRMPHYIKSSIVLQMIGGNRKDLENKTYIRGDVHILLIGDPGQGKSQILKTVASLVNGIYTSGVSCTSVGLTAAVVKDSIMPGKWAVEAGAFVFADNGLLAIDEIDKIPNTQITAIHEAMEQQSLSIAKAGLVMTLNTRCAVLAAGNPMHGQFLPDIPVHKQINIHPTILNRFDLIFMLRSSEKEEETRELSKTILGLHQTNRSTSTNKELLKEYIRMARRIVPALSKMSSRLISELYVKLKKRSTTLITARQLECIIRLVEARAKSRLKEHITEEDVIFVEQILFSSLLNENSIDQSYVETGVTRKDLKMKNLIMLHVKENPGITHEEIIRRHCPKFEQNLINSILDNLVKLQVLFKPTHDTYEVV